MDSDESDFYGDDDLVKDLERKVDNFDVNKWWQAHGALETPLKSQAKGSSLPIPQYHNPYAGHAYAWQLTETVDAFLKRLPPATTEQTPGHAWIWICNPYVKRKSKAEAENQQIRGGEDEAPEDEGADLATLIKAGQERLHFASSFIDQFRQPGLSNSFTLQESKKAGMDAANDILELAKNLRVTCGKWMLFCTVFEVNDVWEIIAKATVKGELGIAAKVAPRIEGDQRRRERLICVYTADFSNIPDVTRVARGLKELGLVRRKPLYYKPDAYTYLGIASNNTWGIKASIYDTRSLLGK
ncbi:hypothetical protein O1611_g8138 [Lasiodiplodia mahajangana]|uniref:Uncharacterized protein n=1 Tax=Lasiodiplodia mahajangana TaxID=1108764 RepID=A0ACC2JDJ1_9PEZI|nr:hypothetical protein O1611_g8138 [Lasiodiplodia mahajangana]